MTSSLACVSCRSLFLGSVLLLAITSRAAAQDSSAVPDGGAPSVAADYPLANAQRPLTLRARLLPIAAVLGFRQTCASSLGSSGCWDKLLSIGGGLAYGITDDLEVGAALPSFQLVTRTKSALASTPRMDSDDPSLYVLYRFLAGEVDLGARVDVSIPLQSTLQIDAGVPLWWKASPAVALRTGVTASMVRPDLTVGTDVPGRLELLVPAQLILQATRGLWVGVGAGFGYTFTAPQLADGLSVPLSVELGVAAARASGAPIIEVIGSFRVTSFFELGNGSRVLPASGAGGADGMSSTTWEGSLGARLYLDTRP